MLAACPRLLAAPSAGHGADVSGVPVASYSLSITSGMAVKSVGKSYASRNFTILAFGLLPILKAFRQSQCPVESSKWLLSSLATPSGLLQPTSPDAALLPQQQPRVSP